LLTGRSNSTTCGNGFIIVSNKIISFSLYNSL